MDGPRYFHTEWSRSDREGEISYDILYVWNIKRNDTNQLTKQKDSQLPGGRDSQGAWMDMYTLLYLKWITNKDLPTAQGTLLNVMCQPGWQWGLGENGYMCMLADSSMLTETITALLIGYTPIQNKVF